MCNRYDMQREAAKKISEEHLGMDEGRQKGRWEYRDERETYKTAVE